MDPSPVQAPPPPSHDVPVKTEERTRPIPASPSQGVPPPQQRVGGLTHKEKFHALRERYESVTSTHTEYTRAVQRATEKEQRLQAEINMLLDAALASSSPQPQSTSTSTPASSAQQPTTTPTPVHAHPSPLDPQASPHALPPPPPGHSRSHSQPQADVGNLPAANPPHAHTNGHAPSSLPAAPHGHPHPHAHGGQNAHAYPPANHAPSTRAPAGIPNEGGGTAYAGAE